MFEEIGFILSFIGATLSIVGSWYVSSKLKHERRTGYFIWILGNPVNIIVLLGAILGLWTCLPLAVTSGVQGYYMYTAYRGWKSNE